MVDLGMQSLLEICCSDLPARLSPTMMLPALGGLSQCWGMLKAMGKIFLHQKAVLRPLY